MTSDDPFASSAPRPLSPRPPAPTSAAPIPPGRPPRVRWTVNAGRLWAGGAAAAVVAALAAWVGSVIVRGVLDLDLVSPWGGGVETGWLVGITFLLGLLATALMHALLAASPRPFMFFGWIVGLLTVLAAVAPFLYDVSVSTQLASLVLFTVVGVAISSLVSGIAETARTRTFV